MIVGAVDPAKPVGKHHFRIAPGREIRYSANTTGTTQDFCPKRIEQPYESTRAPTNTLGTSYAET